jgi:cytochrome c oxidase cbb3-type subunit 3
MSSPGPSGGRAPHEYDGIIEHDNPLPNWWLGIFFGTVIFGYGYWIYYHVTHSGPDQWGELASDEAKLLRAGKGPVTDEVLLGLSKDPKTLGEGQKVFEQFCVPCHGPSAEGKIGPNLTDEYWIYGNKPTDLYRTVSEGGAPGKGMQPWLSQLGGERVRNVVAFVLSKKNTHVPGKEPEGKKYAD